MPLDNLCVPRASHSHDGAGRSAPASLTPGTSRCGTGGDWGRSVWTPSRLITASNSPRWVSLTLDWWGPRPPLPSSHPPPTPPMHFWQITNQGAPRSNRPLTVCDGFHNLRLTSEPGHWFNLCKSNTYGVQGEKKKVWTCATGELADAFIWQIGPFTVEDRVTDPYLLRRKPEPDSYYNMGKIFRNLLFLLLVVMTVL